MSTTYEIRFLDVFGNLVKSIDTPIRLSYSRTVNSVGALTLMVLRDAIPDSALVVDARVEIWRKPDGGTLRREGDGPWLVQTWAKGQSEQAGRYIRIGAVPLIHLLTRRVIAASPGSTASAKYAPSDNLIKAFVREQMGTSASTITWNGITVSRNWTNVAVAPLQVTDDASGTVNLAKDASYRSLLATLQEAARSVNQTQPLLGLYFDIVQTATNTFLFQTYAGQRGTDRTDGPARFVASLERGSLSGTVELVEDWTNAATLVYAGGSGQGSTREISIWGDATAINASAWGLREAFLNAANVARPGNVGGDDDPLAGEAQAELRRLRPTRNLTGDLVSLPGAAYGVDWDWGDRIVAEFEGESFEAIVESVSVTLDRGEETIKAALRSIQA